MSLANLKKISRGHENATKGQMLKETKHHRSQKVQQSANFLLLFKFSEL